MFIAYFISKGHQRILKKETQDQSSHKEPESTKCASSLLCRPIYFVIASSVNCLWNITAQLFKAEKICLFQAPWPLSMQSQVLIVSYAFTQGSMKSKRCLFSLLLFLRNEKKKSHFEGLIINDIAFWIAVGMFWFK